MNTFDRYGRDFQDSIIKALLEDQKYFEEIYEVISHELFQSITHSYLIKKTKEYYEAYKAVPDIEHLLAIVKQEKDPKLIEEVSLILHKIKNSSSNLTFIKEESLKFCLNQKVRIAIEESAKLLEDENYDKIKKIIIDSTQYGRKDLGHNYEKDILKRLINGRIPVSTGYNMLDQVFDGGVGKGELAVICGGPSIGKSFFLINLAKRAMDAGKNVVYFTLELAEGLIGKRFDALITGIQINDLEKRREEVVEIIPKYMEKTGSSLRIKQYPTKKASVSTLQHYLGLLERSYRYKADIIFVDYADILKSGHRGEAKKRFELESVYEELRGMAVEMNIPIWTASQANKEGTFGSEYVTLANMSESFSKAAISDIVLGITRKHDGGFINRGTCYIAKNRGFGRDGVVLPVTFETSNARINIPYTAEMMEKIKTGAMTDLSKFYFEQLVSVNTNNLIEVLDDVKANLNRVEPPKVWNVKKENQNANA